MNLNCKFGFSGDILPVIDGNNKLYIFVKNKLNYRVLLNFISHDINKFVELEPNAYKFISFKKLYPNLQIKGFYMGHCIFTFCEQDINKDVLQLYSNYIINTNLSTSDIFVGVSFLNGCIINVFSEKQQRLMVQLINKDTDVIVYEESFITGEPYVFDCESYINYRIIIYNSEGKEIYNYELDLTDKNVLFTLSKNTRLSSDMRISIVDNFRKIHKCKLYCSIPDHTLYSEQYPDINFIPEGNVFNNVVFFASYKI